MDEHAGIEAQPDGLEQPEPGMQPDTEPTGSEAHIGRRAFIGLMIAGLAALFLGKDFFSWIFRGTRGSSGGTGFRINSVAAGPEFDQETWRLVVDGLVRKPLTLTFSQFVGLHQVERTRDFYCVEGWGVTGVRWEGVTVRELMGMADIDPQATHLILHSGDGAHYTDSLTLDEAMRADTLLAHTLNGEPLAQDMGSPVRLVLPGNYGYKYVKWVVRVEAVALGPEGYSGYWEGYGYPADATIQ
jgi:DMSO/TMAO reductase YedYZ molybdopterin-dependent catalytic subunit